MSLRGMKLTTCRKMNGRNDNAQYGGPHSIWSSLKYIVFIIIII